MTNLSFHTKQYYVLFNFNNNKNNNSNFSQNNFNNKNLILIKLIIRSRTLIISINKVYSCIVI